MVLRKFLSAVVIALSFSYLWAVDGLSIHVSGLFKNTAILTINGQQHTLKVGLTSPEGVKLISANSRRAVVEYNGKQHTLTMGSSGALGFDDPDVMVPITPPEEHKSLKLVREQDGMFRVRGTINNTQVHFLVDTGATIVAMNHTTAERIGIPFRAIGKPMKVETASGIEDAYRVVLRRVRIGDLELSNVEGSVIVGNQPSKVLLGNSFLGKFKVEQDGDHLTIGSRH
ncbi:retropepsin-like aspartic protease family protein [Pleionea litopenaei]|uniref:TIGR02281 family clan AA aspartic protease n=1 Tax=Pleionea litopenaei TaxID=3070815 RepID=A0AA51RS88_9GAMM|nr:TIGR02281 family clan AA aspartic protease [Pleionea sp. HL-JVS1]WMS86676.1 TIGR02281 family clan AA aspartic protease [Pleionea sp. HL-JVS1]